MKHEKTILKQRQRRRFRVRKRLRGNAERPRLSVFRSRTNMYAQLIDDDAGKTLVAASTRDGELSGKLQYGGNVEAAKLVGQTLAQRAIDQGLKKACFDRGSFKYHGRVAALADAAREAGLEF